MTDVVEPGMPFFLVVLIGVFLVFVFLGLIALVLGSLRKPEKNPPLIPSKDGHFEVVGKRVTCFHCGSASFKVHEILLNTWLLSLLRIDWLDSSATVLTCNKCGRLTWFSQEEPADQ